MELVIDGREVTACQLECAETTPSGGDPAADDPSAVPLLDGGADSVQVERKILLPADLEFDLVGIFPRFLQLGKAPLGRDMESIAPLLQREVDSVGADGESVVAIDDATPGEARRVG